LKKFQGRKTIIYGLWQLLHIEVENHDNLEEIIIDDVVLLAAENK
jgi:hypothetical protein